MSVRLNSVQWEARVMHLNHLLYGFFPKCLSKLSWSKECLWLTQCEFPRTASHFLELEALYNSEVLAGLSVLLLASACPQYSTETWSRCNPDVIFTTELKITYLQKNKSYVMLHSVTIKSLAFGEFYQESSPFKVSDFQRVTGLLCLQLLHLSKLRIGSREVCQVSVVNLHGGTQQCTITPALETVI